MMSGNGDAHWTTRMTSVSLCKQWLNWPLKTIKLFLHSFVLESLRIQVSRYEIGLNYKKNVAGAEVTMLRPLRNHQQMWKNNQRSERHLVAHFSIAGGSPPPITLRMTRTINKIRGATKTEAN
jgi:hypothetical protein